MPLHEIDDVLWEFMEPHTRKPHVNMRKLINGICMQL